MLQDLWDVDFPARNLCGRGALATSRKNGVCRQVKGEQNRNELN